uniref:ATP synthase F0 subunit 8 n=1 Tax=Dendronotus frondosus TaxID=71302 RepID=UPI002551DCD4|nr:ATP synthase F0 subunit 8 [Dendronotus frondosus]WGC92343.1 ATP synthase F0 subunit 8 [Dendronotus frondosus]
MPQLSPMMGFFMFTFILAAYLLFIFSVSKAPAKVSVSKALATSKSSFNLFKLWNGSTNA